MSSFLFTKAIAALGRVPQSFEALTLAELDQLERYLERDQDDEGRMVGLSGRTRAEEAIAEVQQRRPIVARREAAQGAPAAPAAPVPPTLPAKRPAKVSR